MKKNVDFEDYKIVELEHEEKVQIQAGNPFWIGVGIGFGAMALYDFVNGVYTGIKLELAESEPPSK